MGFVTARSVVSQVNIFESVKLKLIANGAAVDWNKGKIQGETNELNSLYNEKLYFYVVIQDE